MGPYQATQYDFPREFKGYGETTPDPKWPDRAKIAVSFVINYEEGGENSVLNGDEASEAFLTELPGMSLVGRRQINCETDYEYGSRAGFWRLLRLFNKYNYKFTTYAVGKAFECQPDVPKAIVRDGHEVASHAYRWLDYGEVSIEREKELIRQNIKSLEETTGAPPKGWYYGRLSPNSVRLVYDVYKEMKLPLLYSSDTYSDDLPYWQPVPGTDDAILMIPYSFDNNDFRFHLPTGWHGSDAFFTHLKNAFDTLYEEGSEGAPKMMSIGLHNRIIGKPGRFPALKAFMDYISKKEDVWVTTRTEIAEHWRKTYPWKG